jgi:peptidoglycan/LPS O-acetylase OafA/YrhL
MSENEVNQRDIFGLPKLSTNAEVGISFTLYILGFLMLFSVIYPARNQIPMEPATLGMFMVSVAFFFMIEAVRELEEKDNFLSRKLMQD